MQASRAHPAAPERSAFTEPPTPAPFGAAFPDGELCESLDKLVELAADATGAAPVVLSLFELESPFVAGVPAGAPAGQLGQALALSERVVTLGKAVVVDDPAAAERLPGLVEGAYLGVPVRDATGALLGTLCLHDGAPRAWDAAALRVVDALAEAAVRELERARRRSELAANGEQMRALLNTVDAVFWETNGETFESVFVSEQAERLLGFPTSAWLDIPEFWASRLHPDDRETAIATSHGRVAAGESYAHEYRMLTANDDVVWIRDLVEVMCDERGKARTLRGIMLDVTASKTAELERREVEGRYRALVEHAPNCTYMQDAATYRVTYMSPHVELMLGHSPSQWTDDPEFFAKTLHPDDRKATLAEVERCRESGEPFRMEYRLFASDGRIVWCYDVTVPVSDDRGVVQFRQGFLVDITETKAAHDALISNEARHRALLDHSTDLIAVISADGQYRFVSRSHQTQLGYDPAALLATSSLRLVRPEDVPRVAAAVSAALDGNGPRELAWEVRAADGEWRSLEGVVTRLDDSGGRRSAIVIGRDVTARLAADHERELRASQLQLLSAASIELTSARTLDEIASRAAAAAREIAGARVAVVVIVDGSGSPQALGTSHGTQDARWRSYTTCPGARPRSGRDGGPWSRHDAAGEPPHATATLAVPLTDGGGDDLGFIEVAERADGSGLTESDEAMVSQVAQATSAAIARHRLEQRLRHAQKMEGIGQLAGGIAHDFNNLLTVINGYTQLALMPSTDASIAEEALEKVAAAGERAAALTRQLLTFSRKHVIKSEVFDVGSALDDLVPMLARVIGEDVEVSYTIDPTAAPINTDRALLDQVILNLATNARDAMPSGGRVVISVENVTVAAPRTLDDVQLPAGRYTRVSVRDTGVGMDEQTRARATEPFFTTKEPGTGTGLGLATVHGIVGETGALLSIESTLGKGTIVSVYFPAAVTPATGSVVASANETQSGVPGRVLLVEDDDVVRSLVEAMLEHEGHEVTATGSPRNALTRVRSGPPFDVLVTDVVMPEMSGPELVEQLGARCPPVLFMSGYTGESRTKHGLDGDGIAFLQKPFARAALSEAVAKLRDGARSSAPDAI